MLLCRLSWAKPAPASQTFSCHPAISANTETAETNKIVIADAPVDEKTAEADTDTDAPAATDVAELQPDEIVAAPEDDSRFEIITEDDGPEETKAEDIMAQDTSAEADTEAPAILDDTASTEMASLIQSPEPEPVPPPPPPAPPAQLQPASLVGLTNQSLESEIGAADFIHRRQDAGLAI